MAVLSWALNADFRRFVRNQQGKPLYPGCRFKVTVTPEEILVVHPDGSMERAAIPDLQEFYVATTAGGPWAADVWWIFVASDQTGCAFPGGATGEQDALKFVLDLPGFDEQSFITAMGSTDNARFLCWRRAG